MEQSIEDQLMPSKGGRQWKKNTGLGSRGSCGSSRKILSSVGSCSYSHGQDSSFSGNFFVDGSSSTSGSNVDTETQPPLFKLLKKSKWRRLKFAIKHLIMRGGKYDIHEQDASGLTLLGCALGCQAPLKIIKLIDTADPWQIETLDMFGATALHLACLNGSPSESIRYLLQRNETLATVRDNSKRVPLHHAVECLCRNDVDFSNGMMTIQLLCQNYPNMIHEPNINFNSPIELLHCAMDAKNLMQSDIVRIQKILFFMRKISVDVYKMKKTLWESRIPTVHEKKYGSEATTSTAAGTELSESTYCEKMPVGDDSKPGQLVLPTDKQTNERMNLNHDE